ncbi:MAG: serine/threonine-protein phosphatase [Deltaproteobacteria bacterium]|nr:serine/threonine-protein phosphatase [Deltaproteobacteria bacterium]
MQPHSCGLSDVGRRREINEDSFLTDDGICLYIVADGVGGQAKGEIASAQAVEEVYGFVTRDLATIERFLDKPSEQTLFGVRRLLESAVQSACYMIYGLAEMDPDHKGMSTTISALLLVGRLGIVAQVGDSRVYRHRGGESQQLTEDHTLINYKLKHGLITPEEARKAPGKNVITRAVGHHDYVNVDTFECGVQPGDRFMLCSDGLHGYLRDDVELGRYLVGDPLDAVGEALITLANGRGGKDNITVLLVDINP